MDFKFFSLFILVVDYAMYLNTSYLLVGSMYAPR
jgi:hypothetical protein